MENTNVRAALVDADEVAALCRCSKRHLIRLSDRGLMPPPVRLGTLLRWRRRDIENWIERGCVCVEDAEVRDVR